MKLLLLIIHTLIFTAVVCAQNDKKPEQWPVEVRLNLMITDAAENQVADLKAEDIKLYENDVEQKVTYFAKSRFRMSLL
jgi:hypothetical protein